MRRSPPDSPRQLSDEGRDRNIHAQFERASKRHSCRVLALGKTLGFLLWIPRPRHCWRVGGRLIRRVPTLHASGNPGVAAGGGRTAWPPIALRASSGATVVFTFGAECSSVKTGPEAVMQQAFLVSPALPMRGAEVAVPAHAAHDRPHQALRPNHCTEIAVAAGRTR